MKKKLLAILLAVVMVVSALAVLTACQEPSDEYTVSFSSISGQTYFTLQTKDGKISQTDVEAKTAAINESGKTLIGWYATLGYNQANDETTFSDPIDYDKVYEEDAEYYAKWQITSSGLEQGYTLIGKINGVENWTPGTESEDWMLEQDTTSQWLYRVTVTVIGGDSFKVKEKSDDWHDTCNLGYEGLKEVIVGSDVTLPDGVTTADLITGSAAAKSNIGVSMLVEEMSITVEYDFSVNKYSITINSATILEGEPDYTYIIVGDFENNWNYNTAVEGYIFTAVEDQEGLYELTIDLKQGKDFVISAVPGGWAVLELGSGALRNVTAAEALGDKDVSKLFKGDSSDPKGHISPASNCNVTITYDSVAKKIDILVNSVEEAQELTWFIVGDFEGNSWNATTAKAGYILTPVDGEEGKYQLTIDMAQGTAWQIIALPGGWSNQHGAGTIRNITLASSIEEEIDDVNALFTGSRSNPKDNIVAARGCNVTITLDLNEDKIDILVNSLQEPVTDYTWFLVGSFAGNSWNDSTAKEGYILTAVEGEEGKFQITIDMAANVEWQIIALPGGWSNQHGAGTIETITKADGVDVEDLAAMFEGARDNAKANIKTTVACNVTITLDTTTGKISIHVNSLAAAE